MTGSDFIFGAGATQIRKRQASPVLGTRAVLRQIEPGTRNTCARCLEPVKFAKWQGRKPQVIANVYEDGRWDRVEHFHVSCYQAAGQPYGQAS